LTKKTYLVCGFVTDIKPN